MIHLRLKSGLEFDIDLKHPKNEKGLRDAWYAMSDMPAYQDKKLKMITKSGEELVYPIREIVECRHKPGEAECVEDVEDKTFEFELDKKVNHIINIILQVHGELSRADIHKIELLLLDIFSETSLKVEIDPMHKDFMDAVERALRDHKDRVEIHAEEYLHKYRMKKRKKMK
jgi:tRNA uridine 5-carbamoylmethylation protein Kti12